MTVQRLTAVLILACVGLWVAPANAEAQTTVRVASDQAALRDQGSTTGRVLRTLAKGEVLEVLETTGTWLRVRVAADGATGFIHSLLVDGSVTAPRSAAAAPSVPSPSSVPSSEPLVVPQPSRPARDDRSMRFKAQLGVLAGDTVVISFGDQSFSGLQAGAGVLMRPFANERLETSFSLSYGRGSVAEFSAGRDTYKLSLSSLVGEGHLWYRFDKGGNVVPFVGGGLAYGRYRLIEEEQYQGFFGSVTDKSQLTSTHLNLLVSGGVQFSERFRIEASAGTQLSIVGALRF